MSEKHLTVITLHLKSGKVVEARFELDREQFIALEGRGLAGNEMLEGLVGRVLVKESMFSTRELRISDVEAIHVNFADQVASHPRPAPDPRQARSERRVSRCRSLLAIAKVVLPDSVRQDALDEWMDEIETAAAEGLPVVRRALSIMVRALPRLALRSRLPARARRQGERG